MIDNSIGECLAIIGLHRPRNGHNSAENKLLDRIVAEIQQHFNITTVE